MNASAVNDSKAGSKSEADDAPKSESDQEAGTPASLAKLLTLARRQSKLLEEVANTELSHSTQQGSLQTSLTIAIYPDIRNLLQSARSYICLPELSLLICWFFFRLIKSDSGDAAPLEPERRTTIGRKSLKDRVPLIPSDLIRQPLIEVQRPSEIQPVQEPAESSNRRPSEPRPGAAKIGGALSEDSSEQLKELHARTVESGPGVSLRKDSSYEAYAKTNFKTKRRLLGSQIIIEDLIKFSQKRISEPLISSVRQRDKHDAVAVFAHLMAYMGDIVRKKSERYHLLQLLSCGLRKATLRDEIYCQICKQTTGNPDSVSNMRGWQVMALSCGLFAPSAIFLPVLETHLEQVVHGMVGTSTDKGKSNDEHDPPHFATYSLFRLRKLLRVGVRHLLPLPEEISAVEKIGNISAAIFLPDSTSKNLPFDPMITTEEVIIKIVQVLGLSEPKYFCLWEVDPNQVEKSLGRKEYVAEVQSRWASTCIPTSVDDFQSPFRRCMTCWRKAHKKLATVTDLGDETLDLLFIMESKGEYKPKLLFKRNLYISSQDAAISLSIKNRELALNFSQAVHDVLRGAYPLAENDFVMLAALQLRAELGVGLPKDATGLDLTKYLPQRLEGDAERLKHSVIDIANGLPIDPSSAIRRIDYLDYLKTRYAHSEASWFSAKQTDSEAIPEAFWVAISAMGVYILQRDSMAEILHMKYTEICSWAYSQTSFSIVTGNVTHNEDHRLITLQGQDMSQAMQLFVNQLF